MSSMVEVEHTPPLNMEEVVADLVGKPGRRMVWPILVDQEPIFGFKAKNTVQHRTRPLDDRDHSGAIVPAHWD